MTRFDLNRRILLAAAGSGAALAFAGRVSAATRERNKLVVVIARGAMDGLSVTVPYADPNYAALRGGLAIAAPGQEDGALELTEGFGLHPALTTFHALHRSGQMRFAPAVALPVRIRSHFDAQDVLENGGESLRQQTDGWLNRAIAAAGGSNIEGALHRRPDAVDPAGRRAGFLLGAGKSGSRRGSHRLPAAGSLRR